MKLHRNRAISDMPCRHMEKLVNRYHDKTLSRPARVYVESHLKGCPHCQEFFDHLSALHNKLSTLDSLAGVSHDETAVLERLRSKFGLGPF